MAVLMWILHSLGFGFAGSGGYFTFFGKPGTKILGLVIGLVGVVLIAANFALGAYSYGTHHGVIF